MPRARHAATVAVAAAANLGGMRRSRPAVLTGALALALVVALALSSRESVGAGAASEVAAASSPALARGIPRPPMRFDPIPYGDARKRQMASYSKRHYGRRTWRLENPRAIVLHYTAGSSYSSAYDVFAANDPALGERPGVCAQFIVDKAGTIHQLTRLGVRCRHTVGMNHVSIGIEMVQEDIGSHASERAILARRPQARAATKLAAWLRGRYEIRSENLIGHAMANGSPLFKDLEGWRNDHTDWRAAEVRAFRRRVGRIIRSHRSHRGRLDARPVAPGAAG